MLFIIKCKIKIEFCSFKIYYKYPLNCFLQFVPNAFTEGEGKCLNKF